MTIAPVPKIPSRETFLRTRKLLLLHEKTCVPLLERITRHEVRFFLILDGAASSPEKKIAGLFSFSDGGQILHCLGELLENGEAYASALRAFFSAFSKTSDFTKLFTIAGEERGTSLIEEAIFCATGARPLFHQDSHFFEQKGVAGGTPRTRPALHIENVGLAFFDMLKPMQKAYEVEEVLDESQPFSPVVSNFQLKKALDSASVFIARENGTIVGKAALNAVGENYAQLGGVYTVPAFRRRGIARALVEHVVAAQNAEGKRVVLFAKKKNLPAQKLYENCGFERFGDFKICYYRIG